MRFLGLLSFRLKQGAGGEWGERDSFDIDPLLMPNTIARLKLLLKVI